VHSGAGSLLSLSGERGHDLTAPTVPLPDDLPYSWDADGPLLIRAGTATFWKLETGESTHLAPASSIEVRQKAVAWRRAIDTLHPRHSRVLG